VACPEIKSCFGLTPKLVWSEHKVIWTGTQIYYSLTKNYIIWYQVALTKLIRVATLVTAETTRLEITWGNHGECCEM